MTNNPGGRRIEEEKKALLRADGDAYNDEIQRRVDDLESYPRLSEESWNERLTRLAKQLHGEIGMKWSRAG